MKIAIPVDDMSMKSKISQSFGRTNYFLMYDTDTKESVFLVNSAQSSQGGAGIKAAQLIVDNNIFALISPRCGDNAEEVLKKANILIFKSINDVILDNLNAFLGGNLPKLEDIHPGYHNQGEM